MISRRSQNYGQALFESEASEEMFKQLREISGIFMEPEIMDFFLSFTVSKENKKNILHNSLKHSSPLLKNFFLILLDNKAFSLLPQIVSAYGKLVEERDNVCTGTVYSPHPLSKEQTKDIKNLLQRFFNKRLELNQKEDRSLIGGVYVEAGDYVFDGTVKYYLKHFKTSGG